MKINTKIKENYAVLEEVTSKYGQKYKAITYCNDITDASIHFRRRALRYLNMCKYEEDVLGYDPSNLVFGMPEDTDEEIYAATTLRTKDTDEILVTLFISNMPEKYRK